jgi:hypothetical protein
VFIQTLRHKDNIAHITAAVVVGQNIRVRDADGVVYSLVDKSFEIDNTNTTG